MGMFFGPGKRKGFSSFKVVDRSNKTRKSTVQLPSTLPLEKEQHRSVEDVEQGEEEGEYYPRGFSKSPVEVVTVVLKSDVFFDPLRLIVFGNN